MTGGRTGLPCIAPTTEMRGRPSMAEARATVGVQESGPIARYEQSVIDRIAVMPSRA